MLRAVIKENVLAHQTYRQQPPGQATAQQPHATGPVTENRIPSSKQSVIQVAQELPVTVQRRRPDHSDQFPSAKSLMPKDVAQVIDSEQSTVAKRKRRTAPRQLLDHLEDNSRTSPSKTLSPTKRIFEDVENPRTPPAKRRDTRESAERQPLGQLSPTHAKNNSSPPKEDRVESGSKEIDFRKRAYGVTKAVRAHPLRRPTTRSQGMNK